MLESSKRYELLVRPLGRTAADEYFHQGNVWIEGRDGNEYVIELKNYTSSPAVFIVSIDGYCIRDGQLAGPKSPGLVIAPKSSYQLSTWQLPDGNNDNLIFGRKNSNNLQAGVIGALIFDVADNHQNSTNFTNQVAHPSAIIAVYYNSLKNLQKMGINVRTKRNVNYTASAFPLYDDNNK